MANFYTAFHQYQHVAMSQEWLLSRIKQSLYVKNEGKIRLEFNIYNLQTLDLGYLNDL